MSTQPLDALDRANVIRGQIAKTRADLRNGRVSVGELALSPPEHLLLTPMYEVARLRTPDSRDARRRLEELGRRALRDRVNLMVPLGRASTRSREWLAEQTETW